MMLSDALLESVRVFEQSRCDIAIGHLSLHGRSCVKTKFNAVNHNRLHELLIANILNDNHEDVTV